MLLGTALFLERHNASLKENVKPPPFLLKLGQSLLDETEAAVLERFNRSFRDAEVLTSLGHDVHLIQNPGDDSIPRLRTEFTGAAGEHDPYAIATVSGENPLVLDAGGNIGFVSILAQKVHPKGQVIVFEPSPLTYFFLRCNLHINRVHVLTSEELQARPLLPGVYPVFGGLGAKLPVEYARLNSDEAMRTKSQNTITELNKDGTIPIYNLVSFLSRHGLENRQLDMVKLDCECCEYNVIPASEEWLAGQHKLILTGEIHGCRHSQEQQALSILTQWGCVFPAQNFDDKGVFLETANLVDVCPRPQVKS